MGNEMSEAATSLGLSVEGFNGAVGLTIESAEPDRVVGSVPVGPHLHQPYGIVHGGVYCTIVETLASIGAAVWFGDRGQVVGVSNHTDFLRSVRDGVLHGVATPIHRGRTSQLWLVEVTDDGDKLIARGQVRIANLTEDAAAAKP
jgi:1,4-dihydroxy-2-naphthoyl-CoA hydrolase